MSEAIHMNVILDRKDARIGDLEQKLADSETELVNARYEHNTALTELMECEEKLKEATEIPFHALAKLLQNDPDYAHTWHCNIAMMCYDSIRSFDEETLHEDAHTIANDAASRFMKLCFNVVTKQPLLASDEVEE